MTHHKEVLLNTAQQQVLLNLRFIQAFGDNHQEVDDAIRHHLATDHLLEPGEPGFGDEEFAHMEACVRIPIEQSCDDALLSIVLDLPRLVYQNSLPTKTSG